MNVGDGPRIATAPRPVPRRTQRMRVPVQVAPEARQQMQHLLLSEPFEGTGAGYSALILAAVRKAEYDHEFRQLIVDMQGSHVDVFDAHRAQA